MRLHPLLDYVGGPLLAGLFLLLLTLELRRPLRQRVQSLRHRLCINLPLAAVGAATMRLTLIPAVVWVAARTEQAGWGLVRWLPLPPLLQGVLAFLLLDYTIYVWHWLNHRVPVLWRFHNVHHTDLDLDVSTAFRFHVGELLLSVFWRCGQVALIGVSVPLALTYEIALEAATEFHHSNWRLPVRLERWLNRVFVTPRMHGIHHSIVERETNSNWSVIFCWWDRLHRTLRLNVPQEALVIGVPAYRDAHELTVLRLLLLPFQHQRPTWRLPDGSHPDQLRPPTRELEA